MLLSTSTHEHVDNPQAVIAYYFLGVAQGAAAAEKSGVQSPSKACRDEISRSENSLTLTDRYNFYNLLLSADPIFRRVTEQELHT